MLRLNVYYPNDEGARFDFDYYSGKHLELVRNRLAAAGLEDLTVVKGLAGADGASRPTFAYVFGVTIRDPAKFQALMGEHGADIMGDVANFTNVQPVVQLSEIVTP